MDGQLSVPPPSAAVAPRPLPPDVLARAGSNALQPRAADAPRGLHYTVRVSEGLDRLDVELCFDGPAPQSLIYGTKHAAPFLRDPHSLSKRAALAVQDGRILLAGLPSDACLAYGVDLRAALVFDALMLAYPGDESLLFGAELFLWRPPHRSPELQSTLRFVLPAGLDVSTPWPRGTEPASFVLDESAFAFTGHLVVGHFTQQVLTVPGASLRVTLMPGFEPASVSALTAWIARSAALVSTLSGTFPVADAQVIVAASSPSAWPIHFGHTGRSGGASIVLFMPTDVTADSLRDDWIAIHEFAHLYHPFIRREDAWLSEGLATYLQEVLRARGGLIRREQLWRRLFDGAALGRETTRSLAEDSRRMAFEPNYRRVYWAGAALMLMLDVELRVRSAGALSLDVLLSRLQAQRASFTHGWSARELLAELDELAGLPACSGLARRYLEPGSHMPDLTALYAELGIQLDAAALRFEPIPLAWVRDAIAAPVTPAVDPRSRRARDGGDYDTAKRQK